MKCHMAEFVKGLHYYSNVQKFQMPSLIYMNEDEN